MQPTQKLTTSPLQQEHRHLQQPVHTFSESRAPCQICGKTNHLAIDCYYRMDYAFQGRNPPSQLTGYGSTHKCCI
jgi:hypothetical protein